MISRRALLSALAALPFIGRLFPRQSWSTPTLVYHQTSLIDTPGGGKAVYYEEFK